jgi:hypothetical protein
MPEVEMPEVEMPEVEIPEVEIPEVEIEVLFMKGVDTAIDELVYGAEMLILEGRGEPLVGGGAVPRIVLEDAAAPELDVELVSIELVVSVGGTSEELIVVVGGISVELWGAAEEESEELGAAELVGAAEEESEVLGAAEEESEELEELIDEGSSDDVDVDMDIVEV